jgi:hypothetical protein
MGCWVAIRPGGLEWWKAVSLAGGGLTPAMPLPRVVAKLPVEMDLGSGTIESGVLAGWPGSDGHPVRHDESGLGGGRPPNGPGGRAGESAEEFQLHGHANGGSSPSMRAYTVSLRPRGHRSDCAETRAGH